MVVLSQKQLHLVIICWDCIHITWRWNYFAARIIIHQTWFQISAAKAKQRLTALLTESVLFHQQGGNKNLQKCGSSDTTPWQWEKKACLSAASDPFYILLLQREITLTSGTSLWKSSQQRSVKCQCAGFPGKQATVENEYFQGGEAILESKILSFSSWSHEPHLLDKRIFAVPWPHKESQPKSLQERSTK